MQEPRSTRVGRYVRMVARPGQGPALADTLLRVATSLRDAPGCELYLVNASADEEDTVWVTEVWADVYDAWTDEVIESFPLYASSDPNVFFSDWYASTTLTNCASPDWNVDIVVYDDMGDWTAVYVEPYAYGVTF